MRPQTNQLVVLSLPDLRPEAHRPVGDDPDVLALEAGRGICHIAAGIVLVDIPAFATG
jgi:hypothetical protein